MAAKKTPAIFLLTLVGPHDEKPVKVALTVKELLKWASENPLPKNPSDPYSDSACPGCSSEFLDALSLFPDWEGDEKARQPFGYRVYSFGEGGRLSGWAAVEPYTEYDPRTGPVTNNIDPDQVLSWN